MTIRIKLILSITALFALCFGGLGYGLISLQDRNLHADSLERTRILESTVERAARDALLNRDQVLLLSYVKFLQAQFPSMAYCRVRWEEGGRSTERSVGARPEGTRVFERALVVTDPSDGTRRVALSIGVDESVLDERIDREMKRLLRDLARLLGISLIATVLSAFWFAGRIARPLQALAEAAGQIARGRLGLRLEWKSRDEVGELVEAFNNMSVRLEDLDAMKRDFVSSVTHELRSPLGAIESFLNLLQTKAAGGKPADAQQFWEYFGRIQANVRRLSGFINDLLDVAKIERGKMECHLRPTKVQALADEVVQFFEAKSREQGIELSSRLDPSIGDVQADPERLRQVLVNLVSNALKFTPPGGKVWIQGEVYREGGARWIELAVVDTGRGMDEADQLHIFDRFTQGKNVQAGVRGHKGTGLGLFIVKSIVEAHGGKVSVRSAPGQGAQFLFSLKMS